jgi:ADP-ribose pyrophosphatase YjhB (NUDIX family)
MCLSVFLFVRRGQRILLGKYAEDQAWEGLTGLDPERRRVHGAGWTIPASHLRFGEDPRDAASRVGEEVLGLRGVQYSDPIVEVDTYEPKRFPGRLHYDIWFLVTARLPRGVGVGRPQWYADLQWRDPTQVPTSDYARGHEDVVARWLSRQSPRRGTRENPRKPLHRSGRRTNK